MRLKYCKMHGKVEQHLYGKVILNETRYQFGIKIKQKTKQQVIPTSMSWQNKSLKIKTNGIDSTK